LGGLQLARQSDVSEILDGYLIAPDPDAARLSRKVTGTDHMGVVSQDRKSVV